jgi:hypothetical protein
MTMRALADRTIEAKTSAASRSRCAIDRLKRARAGVVSV